MSKENVKLFIEKIQTDESLQMKLKKLSEENLQHQSEQIVNLSKELGVAFTIEDWKQVMQDAASTMQQEGELDEHELETVAGGKDWVSGMAVSVLTAMFGCLVSMGQDTYDQGSCFINDAFK